MPYVASRRAAGPSSSAPLTTSPTPPSCLIRPRLHGATRWELYRDAERADRFVESFRVPSWEEHLRQHSGRLTTGDQQVEEAALAFSDPPARADHLLPP